MHTQNTRIKNLAWIVSAAILLMGLCFILFLMFEPSPTHAGYFSDKWDAVTGSAKKVWGVVRHPVESLKSAGASVVDATLGNMFEGAGKIAFMITGIFFSMASWLLDATIAQSLDSSLIKNLPAINTGWSLVRDVANMFFIFILLYIAIATILQISNIDWKKTLGKLIIAALLINFSLFFTKVIIDTSNVFATMFFNGMSTDIDGDTYYGPSVIVKDRLMIDSIFDSIDEQKGAGDPEGELKLTNFTRGIIWFGGSIFQMISAFVFLAGAMIFVKRTISLIFLMILSPVAFIGFILPATEKYSKEWWGALTSNALVAPVFLFMLYLVTTIIKDGSFVTMNASDKTSLAAAFVGRGGNFAIILQFVVLIGLIWGALVISQKVCESATKGAVSFAGKVTGGAVAGSAMLGRQTAGRLGRRVSESEWVKKGATSQSGIVRAASRMTLQGGDMAAKSTWDARKTKAGGAMIGGTLNAVSSAAGTGSVDVGFGDKLGQGGVAGARSARDKKMAGNRQNLANIISRDKEGEDRDVKRSVMEEVKIMEKDKEGKMVATGKTKMVAKKDDAGKKIKETVSARRAYADQLKEQAKPPSREGFSKYTYYKTHGQRDRQAIKQAANLVEKGDKETKEQIAKGITRRFERELSSANNSTERMGVVANIKHNELVKMSPDVISQKDVAQHLSKRQIEALVKKQELSDKHLDNIQQAVQGKADGGDEKALGALQYMKGGQGFVKSSAPQKPASSSSGILNQYGKPISSTTNRG